jgi:hypothetical protein
VIRNQKTLACLLFALTLPLPAQAQSTLILPQNQDDIRQLTKPADGGPCTRCGVITNVRSEPRERRQPQTPAAPPASGVGNEVATTPIIASGNAVKDSREAKKPLSVHQLTVRLDDGSYAFFEQDDKPALQKGDRVEVIDGRIERRAN